MKHMDTNEILCILPQNLQLILKKLPNLDKLQEIRIKANNPVILNLDNQECILNYISTMEDLKTIMQRTSNYSLYAFEEEIKQGFITIKGGHRVGLCGKCVMEDNKVKTIKNIASINIRVSREVIGCSDKIMPFIINENNILNTIIISPPKCGKTTILRDMARNISTGMKSLGLSGKKVCIIDERSELAACCDGVPQMKVGIRTDVFDNCLKSEGIIMAIRSMSPEVIVCDEIGTYRDMESILSALSCGVNLISTIHGNGLEDFYGRVVFKDLINNHVFNRAVILSNRNGVGTLEKIYDFTRKDYIWRKRDD
ncbi:stage III sporulation protein AA [Clostridium thermarum]|uniref:stage III sporulation protein AA n=2 Tax=Clostridium thermarum TaxID=1716543 RepID=UPI0011208827|nr:stage III sporulation protein AA [Clostridium thermarum]